MSLYRRGGKRAFDLIATSGALFLLSPLLLGVALLVRVKLGSPVLFTQERTGRLRRPFRIVKFRTMLDARDSNGELLPEEVRLTGFGSRVRAWSIDELPSLWNIVRGEMSIVGPRPFLHAYDKLYTEEQAKRFVVRPGITGWAQINGRNAISWPEKFMLDHWYVDNFSIWLDLKIIWATIRSVLSRHGINAEGATTMPFFGGEDSLPVAPAPAADYGNACGKDFERKS